MKQNRTKIFKFGLAIILGAGFAGLMYGQLNIPTNITNSEITIKKVKFTIDGNSGTAVVTLDGSSSTAVNVSGSMIVGNTSTNTVSGLRSSVIGGDRNQVTGSNSIILGGIRNKINGDYSVIPGGDSNQINTNLGFAAGNYAIVNHSGTFVWSDGTKFESTAPNQFLIRATGGVGINTASTIAGYINVAGSGHFTQGVAAARFCDLNGFCKTLAELGGGGEGGGGEDPTVKAHARVDISSCTATEKLTRNGTARGCATETDPTVGTHIKAITSTDISNWSGKQNRVTGTCPAGQYITSVNTNGTVNCATDSTGTIYTHPTQTAIDVNATDNGVSVIDRVQVNTLGHVTLVSTRNLSGATTTANGVMSAADKVKLNNATNSNTANTIVMRDASGNFSAGTITANLNGNATTATNFQTARTCSAGQYIASINTNGTVTCEPDQVGTVEGGITFPEKTAGDSGTGYIKYDGTTNTIGQFNGGLTNPTSTTRRLNFNGLFYATQLYDGGTRVLTGESDPRVGSLTNSYLPRWSSSSLINSQIYDNGTNIGIGTANPQVKIHLSGAVRLQGLTSSTYATALTVDGNGNVYTRGLNNAAFAAISSCTAAEKLTRNGTLRGCATDNTGTATSVTFPEKTAGDSGTGYIKYDGTTNTIGQFNGGLTNPTSTTRRLNFNGLFYATQLYDGGTRVLTGETDPKVGTLTNNVIPKWSTTTTSLTNSQIYDNGTNIGIGTANPQVKIHLSGAVRFQGLTSSTYATALTVDTNGNVYTRGLNNAAFAAISSCTAAEKLTRNGTLRGCATDNTGTATSVTFPEKTAGDSGTGYIKYDGTTNTIGQFNGGLTNPTSTTRRLNFNGLFYATQLYDGGTRVLTGESDPRVKLHGKTEISTTCSPAEKLTRNGIARGCATDNTGTASSVTVIDNLNTPSTTGALSANQGKILNEKKIGTGSAYFRSGYIQQSYGGVGIGDSIIYNDGSRIGIYTSSPTARLHVNGTVRLQNIGSTSTNTDVLTTDTNGNVTKRGLANLLGSLTNNVIPKWNSDTNSFINTPIYYNGTMLMIGTTNNKSHCTRRGGTMYNGAFYDYYCTFMNSDPDINLYSTGDAFIDGNVLMRSIKVTDRRGTLSDDEFFCPAQAGYTVRKRGIGCNYYKSSTSTDIYAYCPTSMRAISGGCNSNNNVKINQPYINSGTPDLDGRHCKRDTALGGGTIQIDIICI